MLGDWRGAVRSFRWFEKNFPDDIGDPFHFLCGALAFFKSGNEATATQVLRQAMFSNLYLIPRLLGQEQEMLDIWQGSNLEGPEFLDYGPPELWALWDEEALAWAKEIYEGPAFAQARARYIELERQLKDEPVGPRRTQIVSALSKLRREP